MEYDTETTINTKLTSCYYVGITTLKIKKEALPTIFQ